MKVFVIGPVKPFRGGISYSNTMLCENLSKEHEVTAISFKRLYPKVIFKKPQIEAGAKQSDRFKTLELLDSVNPFTWNEAVSLIRKENPDRVIFQWWTTFLSPCYWYIGRAIRKHTTVAVLLQNVFPHKED